MPAERYTRYQVPCLRGLDQRLRRARLMAARRAARGYAMRRGILSGAYDGGRVVRQFMESPSNA